MIIKGMYAIKANLHNIKLVMVFHNDATIISMFFLMNLIFMRKNKNANKIIRTITLLLMLKKN